MDLENVVGEVAQKSGVDVETVRKVLTSTVEFLKGHLPPQFGAQIDMFVRGGGGDGGPGSAAGMPGANPLAGVSGLLGR